MNFVTCNANKKFLKNVIAAIFSFLSLAPSFLFAEFSTSDDKTRIYADMDKADGYSLVRDLNVTESLPKGNYLLKGKLIQKSERLLAPDAEFRLQVGMPEQNTLDKGWQRQKDGWMWSPGGKVEKLHLPLMPIDGNHALDLLQYDELWLDYENTTRGSSCNLSLNMIGSYDNRGSDSFASRNNFNQVLIKDGLFSNLRVLARIDASSVEWVKRDNAYLARRTLGLEFDEIWRYTQSGLVTVVQRRLHQPMDDVEAIDLFFSSDAGVNQVNLLFGERGTMKSSELVTWDSLPRDVTREGEYIKVRLWVGGYLRQRTSVKEETRHLAVQDLHLNEMVVFLRGDAQELKNSKPLKTVVIYYVRALSGFAKSGTNMIVLPAHLDKTNSINWRFVMDMRNLASSARRYGIKFDRAEIALSPSSEEQSCGMNFDSVRLISLSKAKRPLIFTDVQRLLTSLGGPFLLRPEVTGKVEWVRTDAYLPFSLMRPMFPAGVNINSDTTVDFPGWGASLRIDSSVKPIILQESGELVLEGSGGNIELVWDQIPALNKESRMFLHVGSGAEQIEAIYGNLESGSGEKQNFQLHPNKPYALFSREPVMGGAQRIVLRITMVKGPYRIAISNARLFTPYAIDAEHVMDEQLPFWGFIPLHSIAENSTAAQQIMRGDHSRGVTSLGLRQQTVTWRTKIGLPRHALNALKLDYQLNSEPQDACWIRVTLNGKKAKTKRRLCPSGGSIVEPLVKLAMGEDANDVIDSITWEATLPSTTPSTQFLYTTYIGTYQQPSGRNIIDTTPWIDLRHKAYFVRTLNNADIKTLASNGRVWVNLGRYVAESDEVTPPVKGASNPYFQLSEVHFVGSPSSETNYHVPESTVGMTPKTEKPAQQVRSLMAILIGILVLTVWKTTFLRGLLYKISLFASYKLAHIWRLTKNTSGCAFAMLLRHKRFLNRSIVPVIVLLGLWGAVELHGSTAGTWLLMATILWLAAALWHEGRWVGMFNTVNGWRNKRIVLPFMLLLAFTLLLGWTVWVLSHISIAASPLWKMPALLGVVYFAAPWLVRVHDVAKWVQGPWFWLAISVLIYGIGLAYTNDGSENYIYTVGGGIASLLAWRGLVTELRPNFVRSMPRFAAIVYGGPGTAYFLGAILGLVVTALFLTSNLEPIAQQVSIFVYYCLVTGAVVEIAAQRRIRRKRVLH